MRPPVRVRLALTYGVLFLAAGVLLVLLINVLVAYAPFPVAPAAPGPQGSSGSAELAMRAQRAAELRRLSTNSIVALAAMAVLAVLLGWAMAGRALGPVAAMTSTVRRITADRLDRRLAMSGPDDELKKLADTFDDLLDRLQTAFTAQRLFIANASHELRTPLTLQQTLAEVALADPQADTPALRAVLERVLVAGRQQEHLIEALLTLARSNQGLQVRQPVDLAALVGRGLAQRGGTGLRLQSARQPATVSGDPGLLERLVENLADNAARHNVPDGWISVTTGVGSGRPFLTVSNSGPVVRSADVPTLLEPFRRLATDRRSSADGLGLGLSIVAAIVEAHRAVLDIRPRPPGGLDVTVIFPPLS
jgi:signal transduction histidine kinase